MDKNPDWKQLYQESKRELDHHNLQLIELQKGLLRLSLGFIGRNPEFDKLLRLITKTVRANSPSDAIIEGKLLDVINRVTLFTKDDKQLLAEQENLSFVNKYEEELPVVTLENLASFFQKIPADLEQQAEVEILAGKAKLTRTDEELSMLLDEAGAIFAEYCGASLERTIADTTSSTEPFIQLLESLNFDKKSLPKINHTKSILANRRVSDTDPKPYELVANLINKSVNKDENFDEVSDFLKKMTHRLESLHQYLNESDLINSDHFTESTSFSQDLDEQFNELRGGLESSGSITAMKFNIETHLDYLNKNVAEYVRKEKNRMKFAEETMGALNTQLGELQEETEVLKKSVEEEQVKSLTDALTSIANRRAYEERLKLEISRWKRHGGNLSLMVFDLDKFKNINDNFGHVIGDKVLRGLTGTFQRGIRQTDFLARYGGEEFVMIMPETAIDETMVIADKLRLEVEQCIFRYQGDIVPVTVSIGVAQFREGDTAESAFERADQALYLAKKSGRNICRSEEHLLEPS